jgi:hypothetical protein
VSSPTEGRRGEARPREKGRFSTRADFPITLIGGNWFKDEAAAIRTAASVLRLG